MKSFLKHKGLIIFLIFIILIAAVFGVNYIQNQNPKITFYTLETTKNISDLRILMLSDLHLKEYGQGNVKLIEKVESLKPDMIAIVGDMTLENNPDYSMVLSLTKSLTEIAPVFYSAGNHEYTDILYNENTTMIRDIEKTGATFLDDKYIEAEVGDNKLKIGGVCKNASDMLKYTASREMLGKLSNEQDFRLLLSHYPEGFISGSEMEKYPMDLVLCGHAHGGMVRLPFTDGLFAPDQGFLPKLTSGMHNNCGSTVVVGRGLGESHKYELRFNNRPEIVVIDVN